MLTSIDLLPVATHLHLSSLRSLAKIDVFKVLVHFEIFLKVCDLILPLLFDLAFLQS